MGAIAELWSRFGVRREQRKKRQCLRCDKWFWSQGPYHRYCGACRRWFNRQTYIVPSGERGAKRWRRGEDWLGLDGEGSSGDGVGGVGSALMDQT